METRHATGTGRRVATGARRAATVALAVAGIGAYAWWASGLEAFTWPERLATGLPAVVVIGYALRHRARRLSLRRWIADSEAEIEQLQTRTVPGWGALVTWGVLIALLLGWEFTTYAMQPRAEHPTLSAVVNLIAVHHAVRGVFFVVWLALGWDLLRR